MNLCIYVFVHLCFQARPNNFRNASIFPRSLFRKNPTVSFAHIVPRLLFHVIPLHLHVCCRLVHTHISTSSVRYRSDDMHIIARSPLCIFVRVFATGMLTHILSLRINGFYEPVDLMDLFAKGPVPPTCFGAMNGCNVTLFNDSCDGKSGDQRVGGDNEYRAPHLSVSCGFQETLVVSFPNNIDIHTWLIGACA